MAVTLCFPDQCFSAQFLGNFVLFHSYFGSTPPISQTVLTSVTLAPNRAHTTVGPAAHAYNTPSVRRVRRWTSGWKCSYHVLRWFGTVSAVRRNQGRDAGTTTITPKTPKSFFSHGLFMSRLTGFRDINHSSSRVL